MPTLLMLKALPWRLIGIVSIAFAVLALFAHDRMVVAQNVKLKAQIAKLVDQSREKQSEVREVIRQGKDRVVVVEREAKRVESAPLEGECRTPKLVLEADI